MATLVFEVQPTLLKKGHKTPFLESWKQYIPIPESCAILTELKQVRMRLIY